MASYHDARSPRPHQDASSSSSAGSSYLALPRQADQASSEQSSYHTPSNMGASGNSGGPGYPSTQFNSYSSSHSQQHRPPHLPPPQPRPQQQPSYSSLPSHPPHPHSTYHHPHTQRPPPTQPPPSMSYGNFDYSQPVSLFPHGYPSFRMDTTGRAGQGNNGTNGSGGGQVARHPQHSSTPSAARGEDLKPSYPYFASTNATGQPSSDSGGAQRNGVQDEWNPVSVPPLPPHVEANIFANNAPWPFNAGDLDQGSNQNGAGGNVVAECVAGAERKQPSDAGTGAGQPTSSPPVPTQTIAKPVPSAPNNADNSQLNIPDLTAFGLAPSSTAAIYDPLPVALPSQLAPPTDPLLVSQPQDGWALAVEPDTFLSGLEGISGLPLHQYHATSSSTTGLPESLLDMQRGGNLTHENEVQLLAGYLREIIQYLEPFATTRDNPTPTHPPPFLHTRILRLAVIVRNGLRHLEKRSQPCLEATFRHAPPGVEQTEADKEMAAIRDRRQELKKKQDVRLNQTNGNGMPVGGGATRPTPPRPGVNLGSGAPRPYLHTGPRDVYRCAGCNTTQSLEWLTGPDGSQSLCQTCGHQYEVLNHARQGDPDFSSIPVPGHNSNIIGVRPS